VTDATADIQARLLALDDHTASAPSQAAARIRTLEAERDEAQTALDANWVTHQRVVKAEAEAREQAQRIEALTAELTELKLRTICTCDEAIPEYEAAGRAALAHKETTNDPA